MGKDRDIRAVDEGHGGDNDDAAVDENHGGSNEGGHDGGHAHRQEPDDAPNERDDGNN